MVSERLLSRLKRIDWDFCGTFSESPFSTIHWHPARFVSQLPAAFIGVLSEPGQTVLDPFMGSGTTLVEAQRLGLRSIGIDIGYISCLIARAKTCSLPSVTIKAVLNDLLFDAVRAVKSRSQNSPVPKGVQADKWYTKRVQKDLSRIWRLVTSYHGVDRILSEAAFSATLLPVCRETRHWGYVCDNSTPKSDHEGNVLEHYCKTLNALKRAYEERDSDMSSRSGQRVKIEKAKVIAGDCKEVLKSVPGQSVDIVVTSPPYFGVSDYIKSQRLSMEWFGYSVEPLRQKEIGARSKRHRKRALDEYIQEIHEALSGIRACLKPGGALILIVGQSSARTPIMTKVKNTLRQLGFDLCLEINRRVSSQRRQAPSIQDEHVFVCR